MGREEQLEEITNVIFDTLKKNSNATYKDVAEAIYNAGYRKTFTSDFASDTQKAYKEGYDKGFLDCVNYNANEQEISKARDVLIKDLKDVPVGQFLFIEDGSVDLTELKDLKRRNPEIKIVVYKQGSVPPILKDC